MNRCTVAAAAVVSLVTVFAAGCKKPEGAAEGNNTEKARAVVLPAVAVETAAVELRRMPRHLTLTGSVVANLQSEMAANVSGRVVATMVERGQAVKGGQLIALVDSKAAGFSAAAAAAQANLADTQGSQARQDCARAEQLMATNAIAKAEYDRLKSQCAAQLWSARAAGATASLARKLAGATQIRAPFTGVIGERYVNPGEYVQPPTRVASIYSLNPVRVSISVPETAVGQIKDRQSLDVHVAAWPDRSFPAMVRYVSPALRAQTRDLLVEASADNKDGALRPGMFATVSLLVGDEMQPTVPSDALKIDGTVKRIFLARDGQAFEMVVRTGATDGGRTAVLEPLDDKTLVIRRPPPGLHDGSPILLSGAASRTAPGAALGAAPGVTVGTAAGGK